MLFPIIVKYNHVLLAIDTLASLDRDVAHNLANSLDNTTMSDEMKKTLDGYNYNKLLQGAIDANDLDSYKSHYADAPESVKENFGLDKFIEGLAAQKNQDTKGYQKSLNSLYEKIDTKELLDATIKAKSVDLFKLIYEKADTQEKIALHNRVSSQLGELTSYLTERKDAKFQSVISSKTLYECYRNAKDKAKSVNAVDVDFTAKAYFADSLLKSLKDHNIDLDQDKADDIYDAIANQRKLRSFLEKIIQFLFGTPDSQLSSAFIADIQTKYCGSASLIMQQTPNINVSEQEAVIAK